VPVSVRCALACGLAAWLASTGTATFTQGRFVDDAKRGVELPPRVLRVFAAGGPAEVLLHTLAPDRLVGRNRVPEGDALEFFPPAYRNPVVIRQLPEVDNPAADAELLKLRPDLYVDYGTIHEDYIAAVEAVQRRTRVPGIILDGALAGVPDAYRRLGSALGVSDRGERLAAAADRLLTKYRGRLASVSPVPRVYIACSADGFVPCLEDDPAGEQLRWIGGLNVARTRATAPRRPLTIAEIQALAPHVVVTGATGGAVRLRESPQWQTIEAVRQGRVYDWPAVPYSWGPRPPSVNRLPGVMWLAYVSAGRAFDAQYDADVREFFSDFYQVRLIDAQLRRLR
jgi:iron complex transport system substrate-binding protein